MARWIPILATCSQLLTVDAFAQSATSSPQPEPAEANEQRLQWILDTASSNARQSRVNAEVLDGAFSAMVIPPGVVLASRSDRGLEAVGISLLIDGGWAILRLAWTPSSSGMEKLQAHHDKLKASGADLATVVKETEVEFRDLASRPRWTWPWLTIVRLVQGTALVGAGMYLLLSNSPPVDRAQTTLGAIFVGVGMPSLPNGIYDLLPQPPSTAQYWWSVYQMAKVPQPPAVTGGPSLSLAPIPHGAAASAHFSF